MFVDSVYVGPEVVGKGFWYLDVCEPAGQQFAQGQAKMILKTPQGRWLTVRSRKRDGTLYNEPSKRGKKVEPEDPPPAGLVAVSTPASVLYPPRCAPTVCVAGGPWAMGSGIVECVPSPPSGGRGRAAPAPLLLSSRYYPLQGWL